MLVIRLARTGRHKYPTYRIVAAESARPVTGKFVAILGHYNPHTKNLVLKAEEVVQYIGNGAQPSNSVIKLLQREKIKLPDWVTLKTKNKPAKKAPEPKSEKSAAPAEAAADSDAPVEPADSEKVATTAAEHAEEVKDKLPEKDIVETAAMEEAQAEVADQTEAKAAEVALEAGQEESSKS